METWREALKTRGIIISKSKTEYMSTDIEEDQELTIELDVTTLRWVSIFNYLGSITLSSGDLDREIGHRIQSGWNNWRMITGVLCDKKVPLKLRSKKHKAIA